MREGADVTLVSAMRTLHECLAAAETLAGEGVECEVIDLRTLRPLDGATILRSVAKTNRLVVVEEGPRTGGWAGEVLADRGRGGRWSDLDAIRRLDDARPPDPLQPAAGGRLPPRRRGDRAGRQDAVSRRAATVPGMASNEKPQVDVPSDQPPSYQLELDDLEVGDGDEAVSGKVVEVHYVGVSWATGEQFDASWDRGDTFKFKLGKGQVISGWDQGVAGMKVGGRRRITIPPQLAYGKRGAGGVIGPDETLVFVVDLVGVAAASRRRARRRSRRRAATSTTASRWSPCSSMTPSLTDPPTPQRFFRRPASSRRPSSSSGTSATVVTALPRRPLVSRRTLTRPPAAIRALSLGSRALRRSPSVLDHTTLASRLGIRATVAQRALHRRA